MVVYAFLWRVLLCVSWILSAVSGYLPGTGLFVFISWHLIIFLSFLHVAVPFEMNGNAYKWFDNGNKIAYNIFNKRTVGQRTPDRRKNKCYKE
ncbi:hypothetical protein D3Z53_17960 [Lachnospiraceae bacterium]|jgi:hypothetical protein|nr:hypothetical protein [Lachnospiraceae bacterium]